MCDNISGSNFGKLFGHFRLIAATIAFGEDHQLLEDSGDVFSSSGNIYMHVTVKVRTGVNPPEWAGALSS